MLVLPAQLLSIPMPLLLVETIPILNHFASPASLNLFQVKCGKATKSKDHPRLSAGFGKQEIVGVPCLRTLGRRDGRVCGEPQHLGVDVALTRHGVAVAHQ